MLDHIRCVIALPKAPTFGASHLLAKGVDIRTIQSLLGHRSLETTMIYTHIQTDYDNVSSPLDQILRD
jgi:site-specific recombinase XerC